jgi:hypothetical protein
MIVNAAEAEDVVEVFSKLFEAGYPIEQMRVVRLEEVDDHPTGDWNETTSFVCRPAVGSSNWSQHADFPLQPPKPKGWSVSEYYTDGKYQSMFGNQAVRS